MGRLVSFGTWLTVPSILPSLSLSMFRPYPVVPGVLRDLHTQKRRAPILLIRLISITSKILTANSVLGLPGVLRLYARIFRSLPLSRSFRGSMHSSNSSLPWTLFQRASFSFWIVFFSCYKLDAWFSFSVIRTLEIGVIYHFILELRIYHSSFSSASLNPSGETLTIFSIPPLAPSPNPMR